MKNAYLPGQQIYLRPLEKEDAKAITHWFNDPEVRRTLDRYLPMTLQEEEAFLAKLPESQTDVVLGIALAADDRLIGVTGLHGIHAKNRAAVFGILIGEKAEWGKGHGTEAVRLMARLAFETLNLNRIELHVRQTNDRGIRAYERVGYKREGLLRQDSYVEGRYVDTIVMGLLRADWDERRAPS